MILELEEPAMPQGLGGREGGVVILLSPRGRQNRDRREKLWGERRGLRHHRCADTDGGGDRQRNGGQAAIAISDPGLALKSCPKPEPNLPLRTAQRTWSRRSAPRRDQRICCDLFMRRLTRKLAVPSVNAVPTRSPARCRSP